MPKIPTYDSRLSPTTEAPAIRVNPNALSQASQAMAQAGETLSAVGEKLNNVQAQTQVSKANVAYLEGVNSIFEKASKDTDSNGFMDRRTEELTKLRDEVFKGITNPKARQQFDLEYQRNFLETDYKLKTMQNKLIIDERLTSLDNEMLTSQENYYKANEREKELIVNTIAKRFSDAAEDGVMTKQDAAKNFVKWKNGLVEGQVEYDIQRDNSLNPENSYVYKQLKLAQKGEGEYAKYPKELITKSLENIQLKIGRNIRINGYITNQNQDKNEAQMMVNFIDGNLQEENIREGLLSNSIRIPFGEKMLKKVYEGPVVKTDYTIYNKVREMQLSNATPQEINQFILDNSNKISDADKKFLIDKTFSEVDNKQKIAIRYNSNALKNWVNKGLMLDENMSDDLVYEFHRRVNQEGAQGSRIDEIAQELQKEKIKELYPPTALTKDVPNFIANRNQLKKVYERESKLKGKPISNKPVNAVIGDDSINFDDL